MSQKRIKAEPEFISQEPWQAERPETLVVCCSDGRWHAQIEEFVRHEISTRADMYVVPGGPAGLSLWSSSFEEGRLIERAFQFLAKHHDLKSTWLIGHENCAYYLAKYSSTHDEQAIFRRQLEDLERARATIASWRSDLAIKKVFASLENGCVIFRAID